MSVHFNGKDRPQNYGNIHVVEVDFFVDKMLNTILSHLWFDYSFHQRCQEVSVVGSFS